MAWHLEIHVSYRLATSYAVQGSGAYGSNVDQQVVRGPDGWPLVPASSWRGRTRAHLESLLRGLGVPVCYPPDPAQTCPHNPEVLARLDQHGRRFCPVCDLFGSPWFPSRIRFTDLTHPRHRRGTPPVAERVNVAINRCLGSVEEQRLFSYETAGGSEEAARTLEGRVVGNVDPVQVGLLLAALRLPTHLGGKKARGLGLIEAVTFPAVQVRTSDGSEVSQTQLAEQMATWINTALEEVMRFAVPRSL